MTISPFQEIDTHLFSIIYHILLFDSHPWRCSMKKRSFQVCLKCDWWPISLYLYFKSSWNCPKRRCLYLPTYHHFRILGKVSSDLPNAVFQSYVLRYRRCDWVFLDFICWYILYNFGLIEIWTASHWCCCNVPCC